MSTNELEAWFFPSWPDNATVVPFGAAVVAGWWSDFSGYTGGIITNPDDLVDVYMVDVQTRQTKLSVISGINVNRTAYFIYNISDARILETQFWEFDLVRAGDMFLDYVDFVRSPRFSIRDFKDLTSTSPLTTTTAAPSAASEITATKISAAKSITTLVISSASSASSATTKSPAVIASPLVSKAAIASIVAGSVAAGAILMLACLLLVRIIRNRRNKSHPDMNAAYAPEVVPPSHLLAEKFDGKIGQFPTKCEELGQTDFSCDTRSAHELDTKPPMIKVPPLPKL